MKNPLFILSLLVSTFFYFPSHAQNIQKLLAKLDTTGPDSARSDIYYAISLCYWNRNADSILYTAGKALETAQKGGYEKGMALALLSQGVALDLKEEYPGALDCYLRALRISERLKLEQLTENIYDNIGNVYSDMNNYSQSTQYYLASLKITQKYNDRHETGILFVNLAETYKKTGAYDSALTYNARAMAIMTDLHDSGVMATILLNTGDDYNKMGQPEKALHYFYECSSLAGKIHDDADMVWASMSIAEALLLEKKYTLSIRQAQGALDSARRFSFAQIIEETYSVLYNDYKDLGNFRQSLEYRNLEIAWKDSLNTTEKEKKIRNLQTDYELERQQHQIDMLRKDNLLQQQEITGERQRHTMFAAGALFFGMWAIFLYKSNKEKERLNRLLQTQDHETTLPPYQSS